MLRDKQMYKDAAKRLKAMREAKGISVPAFADRLGVSTARYRTWEKTFGPLPQRQYGDAINRILEDWEPTALQLDDPSSHDVDQLDYAELGNRAAERRKSMGLSRVFVAGRIEIGYTTFCAWELSLPRHYHGGHEDAWENALEVPRGWLRHPSWPAPDLSAGTLDLTMSEVGSVADEIRAVGSWLTRKHPSGRIHEFSELSEQEQRQAIMFADRYGVCGENRTSLQVIGDQFGLTRERVRQVVEAMAERARDIHFTLPKLEELKAAASGKEIQTVTSFEELHRDLLGGVSLSDADRFAREILGTSIAAISDRAFAHGVNSVQPMIIDPAVQEIVIEVRTASLRMVRSCGAAHTMFVTGLVSEVIGKAVSIADVRYALVAIEGMQWLTPDEDWYWLGPDTLNNRVLEGVRKVLATASRKVDVEDLHQAVCRSRRAYYKGEVRSQPPEIEVPQEVLREILSRVPWLTVIQMNDFVLAEEIAIEDVLNSSELKVVRVIEEHGGAATRNVFNNRFVKTGIFSIPNLQIVLNNSPVIQPLAFGVYGIRGREFPEKAFSTAHASTSRSSIPVNMTDDGWCEFQLTISEPGMRNGIVDIPIRAAKALTPGVYTTEGLAKGTISLGTVQSVPARTSGLTVLLQKAGIQGGEPLKFSIHPETMRAMISRAERLEPSE
jgi:hypothetical protein